MPSKKQYNLVHNDEYDTRIPLHSEEAFHRGILFHAKVGVRRARAAIPRAASFVPCRGFVAGEKCPRHERMTHPTTSTLRAVIRGA